MLQAGDVLQGRYLIERLIGTGGMGSVYLARQAMLGNREVALKEVNFDAFHADERLAAMEQFQREAQILATLKHANLVDVKDCFEENATIYLVMDYVEGQNLEELLAAHPDTPVPYDILQDWTEQLCEVLEYLHSRRPPIIFRDLKPANVMLDGQGVLHLVDFGIARVLEADSMDLAEMQGTPGYAPMEQIQMKNVTPDARTDVFALGATLYNLITREHPSTFFEETDLDSARRPIPPALHAVITRMMEMRPDNRQRSVAEVRAALHKAFAEPMKAAASNRRVSLDETVPTRRSGLMEERRRATETLPAPRPAPRPTGGLSSPRPAPVQSATPTLRRGMMSEPPARAQAPSPVSWAKEPQQPSPPHSPDTRKLTHTASTSRMANGPAERPDPILTAYLPDLFGRRMELVFISFSKGRLRFRCPKKPRLAFPLKAFFFDGTRQSEVTLQLLDTVRTEQTIQYDVEVRSLPAYMQPMLARQLTTREVRQELRRLPRLSISFQVTSPELPGYKATGLDLSLLGTRLQVSQPMEIGRSLELCLELGETMIKVPAEARWCTSDPQRGFQVGFKFGTVKREAIMALDAFMQRSGRKVDTTALTEVVVTLDVGTSSVRAKLFDSKGEPVGDSCSRPQTVRTSSDGAADIDADDMVDKVRECLAGVERHLQGHQPIGIAVSTFWHSAVGVGRDGRAVTPVLTWADTRARRQVEFLRGQVDAEDLHRRTGCLLHTSYLPARLLWAAETHADWSVARWLSPGEYLMEKLCGQSVCSLSMASATGLFDSARRAWDGDLLKLCRIEPEQLPAVALHGLTAACGAGRDCPALDGVPWLAPLGDGACSNVGSGAVAPGDVAVMLGTSGAVRLLAPWPVDDWSVPAGLWRYALDGQHVLFGGALSNGGNLYAWLTNILKLDEPMPSDPEPDAHGLTVLPFLAGERSPGWRGEARAVIHGLSWNTRPVDILQAGMEAVVYRLALVRELLRARSQGPARIIASGGAFANSPVWLQMLADCLGEEVLVSGENEASSRGAALMALVDLGRLSSFADASQPMAIRYRPRPDRHRQYLHARRRQMDLYRTLWETP